MTSPWEKVLKKDEIYRNRPKTTQKHKKLVGKLYLIIKELQRILRKPKKAWEKLGKTIIDNQWVITDFDNFVRKTFLMELDYLREYLRVRTMETFLIELEDI